MINHIDKRHYQLETSLSIFHTVDIFLSTFFLSTFFLFDISLSTKLRPTKFPAAADDREKKIEILQPPPPPVA
jgi:hypothetical protein